MNKDVVCKKEESRYSNIIKQKSLTLIILQKNI